MTDRIKIDVKKIGTFSGHRDCLYTIEDAGQKHQFLTSGGDGMVVAWNLDQPDQGKLIANIANTVYALHINSKAQKLYVGENTQGVHLIDMETLAETHSVKLTEGSVFDIKQFNDLIIVAMSDGEIAILSAHDLSIVTKFKASSASARCIAVHPQRKEFAVGFSDNNFRIFAIDNFKPIYQEEGHTNSIFSLNYSPNGRFLLSGSRDAHLKIWDADEGYKLHESIVAHMFTINHIAFRKDGRYFATCSKDKSVKVWDAHNFKLLKVIDKARHAGHGTSVNKLYWANDNTLVSVSDDRTVSVWQLQFHLPTV